MTRGLSAGQGQWLQARWGPQLCWCLFSTVLVVGCRPVAAPAPPRPASPPPPEAPAPIPIREDGEERYSPPRLEPSTPMESPDPILDSPWARAEGMEERVSGWVESLRGKEADRLRTSLVRMGRYGAMVEEELRRRGLPRSLAFLPIVESWYNPTAFSRAGAAGLWQFMPGTARGMGLSVDRLLDERRDPFRSTPAALDYLAGLKDRFGSWFLALAAYNSGPGRIERALRRRTGAENGHDGLFLEILDALPRETRDFVPRFLAAARIARDPAAYGFAGLEPDAPLEFDEVEIEGAVTLDVVARAAGVSLEAVRQLNPQLPRGFIPATRRAVVRLPAGAGARFAQAFPEIPEEERVTFVEHRVEKGQTLTHIARLYGVSVADLRAANPRIQPRRMQIGQRVVVPKAPSVRSALRGERPATGSSAGVPAGGLTVYEVRAGDTLSGIAARHGVSLRDLLRWNGWAADRIIRPGDEVKLYLGGG